MKTEPNTAAFPRTLAGFPSEPDYCPPLVGLTKREWFAGMALSGLLADSQVRDKAVIYAYDAVEIADLLIEVLNGSPTQ